MKQKLLIFIAIFFCGFTVKAQQVLGDFTGADQSEWPKVIWYDYIFGPGSFHK